MCVGVFVYTYELFQQNNHVYFNIKKCSLTGLRGRLA